MAWWPSKKRHADLDRELRSDLELEAEEQRERGVPADEARYAALRAFGNPTLIREQTHDTWRWTGIERIWRDVLYALRQLKRSPGFALTVVLTLALGIGANAAIFQLLDAVRLRSLPVEDPQSLALIHIDGGDQGFGISKDDNSLSYAVWQEISRMQKGFSGVFAWTDAEVQLGSGNDKKPTHSVWVSGDAFSTLGVIPIRGRLFNSSDDRPGCGIVGAVISDGFWKAQLGGNESAVGSILMLDDRPTQILGITPPRFSGIDVGKNFEIALPICSLTAYHPMAQAFVRHDYSFLTVMGRIKPGWTLAQASDQLRSISPAIFKSTLPTGYAPSRNDFYQSFRLRAYSAANGISDLRESFDSALWLLLGITGLVLLIACANLAGLMLVRATARQAEMAVRLAIGASRSSLIRQLFAEAMLTALAGAGVGIAMGELLMKALGAFLDSGNSALYLDTSLDWRMLAFLAFVTSLTCVIFGLIPAFRASRIAPIEAIKSRAPGGSTGRRKSLFQKALVAGQINISLVLLVAAVCFVRSFTDLMTLDAGFNRNGLIVASVDFSHVAMPLDRDNPFLESLVGAIETLPQVHSAAAATHVPLDGSSWTLGVRVDTSEGDSKYTWITPGYFQTMGMQILKGRNFTGQDTASSLPAVIVNQTFVRDYLNGQNPIGKLVVSRAEPNYPSTHYQIVGVVNDTKYADLKEEIPPQAFVPYRQFTAAGPWGTVFIRGSQAPDVVIPAVRERLQQFAPQARTDFKLLNTQVEESLVRERLMAILSAFFGALALILAAIGLYGLISYTVADRTCEIGIRLALGAPRALIVWHFVRDAAVLVCIGLLPGLALAIFAIRGAHSLLFGFNSSGWTSFVAASSILLAVALFASWWPARHAASVDPMKALRSE